MDKDKVYDLRLRTPFRLMLAGSSGCGKTTKTLKLLQNANVMFNDSRCLQNVIYFYKQDQDFFKNFKGETKPAHRASCRSFPENVQKVTTTNN